MKKNNLWFSIIEIIVWIFIFTIWLTWVYMLLLSSMSMNEYSKNSIIASSLASESIEDIVNLRDNNYMTFNNYNKLPWTDFQNKILTWVYYKVQSDLENNSLNYLKVEKIEDFKEWKDYLLNMSNYRLYLDENNNYTYENTWNKPTIFYRYVVFDNLYEWGKYLTWALKITSKVIWYSKWYHEIKLDSIITDWQRN